MKNRLMISCIVFNLFGACSDMSEQTDSPRGLISDSSVIKSSCLNPAGGDFCGKKSPDGCWCDNLCTKYNDCCDDKQKACDNPDPIPSPTPTPTPTPTPGPDPKSCVGICGKKAPGGCWCDDLCEKYNDCCADKKEACETPPPTPTPNPCPPCMPCIATVSVELYDSACTSQQGTKVYIKSEHCSGITHTAEGLAGSSIEIESCGQEDGIIYAFGSENHRDVWVKKVIDCNQPNPIFMDYENKLTGEVVFDDFEIDTGWSVNPFGTDTAVSGSWARAMPEETASKGIKYQRARNQTVMATGPLAGEDAQSHDVDGGVTSIKSPLYSIPDNSHDTTLWFRYHFSHDNNATTDDYFRVKAVGTETKTIFELLGAPHTNSSQWQVRTINLNEFKGQDVYFLFEAADEGQDSLIEAAFEDFNIFQHLPPTPMPFLTPESSQIPTSLAPNQKRELWSSSGDTSTTQLLKSFESMSSQIDTAKIGNSIVFIADDGIHGTELWRSDGTAEGTFMIKDIIPGKESPFTVSDERSVPYSVNNSVVYFRAKNELGELGLWKSDGTPEGTVMIKSFVSASLDSTHWYMHANNTLFFPVVNSAFKRELWKSDGTEQGTKLVKDLNTSHLMLRTNVNGLLLFEFMGDNEYGIEPWVSDGTEMGTTMLKDIYPGPKSSSFRMLGKLNQTQLFCATTSEHGSELWKTDGTKEGTVLVKDLTPGPESTIFGFEGIQLNDSMYFLCSNHDGTALCKSDGTEQGTEIVYYILPKSLYHGKLHDIVKTNDRLYFVTEQNDHELHNIYSSDGTEEGTMQLKKTLSIALAEYQYATSNKSLFFTNRNCKDKLSVWSSDGTPASTKQLHILDRPWKYTGVNNTMYFFNDPSGNDSLWKSNGTQAGTVEIKNGLNPEFNLLTRTTINDTLFFLNMVY